MGVGGQRGEGEKGAPTGHYCHLQYSGSRRTPSSSPGHPGRTWGPPCPGVNHRAAAVTEVGWNASL